MKNKGMSLIEVIIAIGIMSLISFAFMSMIDNQQKQLAFFQNKSDLVELKNFLVEAFSKSETCDWQLSSSNTSQNLNLSNKKSDGVTLVSEIAFSKLFNGNFTAKLLLAETNKPLSNSPSAPIVDKMTLKNIKPISTDVYQGEMEITFKKTFAPINFRKNFKLDTSNPTNASIVSCYSGTNLRVIGGGTIQSLPSDCGNVVCKNITFMPGCPVNKMITNGSVLYPTGGGTWGHYTYLFQFMSTAGTGRFCWDTGGDFTGCYGTEQFSYTVYCQD